MLLNRFSPVFLVLCVIPIMLLEWLPKEDGLRGLNRQVLIAVFPLGWLDSLDQFLSYYAVLCTYCIARYVVAVLRAARRR